MKTIIKSLIFATVITSFALAEDDHKFPDLSKAFPEEKLFMTTKLDTLETYAIATNLNFEELKIIFIKYIGEEWKEIKPDDEDNKDVKRMMEENDMNLLGMAMFENPKFPDINIGLLQMKMELEGKNSMLSITKTTSKK